MTLNSDHSSPTENFNVALGYTVTGTVAYSGSKTGRIYVQLAGGNCGGQTPGTSVSATGAFTIRGVPPGSYTLQGFMDNLGQGAPNASNPSGSVRATVNVPALPTVTVTGSGSSHPHAGAIAVTQPLTLSDPGTVTLSSAPQIQGAAGFNTGAVVFYKAITNNNGVEMAASYTLQWSTSSSFASVTGSKIIPATGSGGSNIWMVNGLTNGTDYYFRAEGVAGSSTSQFSSIAGPVTVNPTSGGSTITGTVTFSGTAKGPLYTGFYNNNTNQVYLVMVGSQASPPTSPASYSVSVPNGTGYFQFGIIDQNNDGTVDLGDISDTDNGNGNLNIDGNATGINLTLPSAVSTALVTTQVQQNTNQNGTGTNYNLDFQVRKGIKLPVAVSLVSATNPDVIVPMDIGQCTNCGGSNPYNFSIGLANFAPTVGDAYGFQVTYSDGTTSSPNLSTSVSAVLNNALATNLSPEGTDSNNQQPTFTWDYPASASSYIYQFQLQDSNYNTIWAIPCQNGNNCNSNGFSSSINPSITWGTDPPAAGARHPCRA